MTPKPPNPPKADDLYITVLPDIFRAIGPGDDVVVSAEKVLAWRESYAAEARIDENLACCQIMTQYWKTGEMLKAASERRAALTAQEGKKKP